MREVVLSRDQVGSPVVAHADKGEKMKNTKKWSNARNRITGVVLHSTIVGLMTVLLLSQPLAASGFTGLGHATEFAMLGLPNGSVTISEGTNVFGDFGYAAGVVSTTNQKVPVGTIFDSTVYVDSTAVFDYTQKNFLPSGGIVIGGAADAKLALASADAISASAEAAALTPVTNLGVLGDDDNRTLNSTGSMNVFSITSLNYNYDWMQLNGGLNDYFIFNVLGNFDFSGSEIRLSGVTPDHILWNFPNASSILVNKDVSKFYGTILAPTGTVNYHNPGTFGGAIIAKTIYLHSAFNLTNRPFAPVPEPSALLLALLGGVSAFGGRLIRKRR